MDHREILTFIIFILASWIGVSFWILIKSEEILEKFEQRQLLAVLEESEYPQDKLINLEDMTKKELKQLGESNGLSLPSSLKKGEMIERIRININESV